MPVKLEIRIPGTPRISPAINYTRKGEKYKPVTVVENENTLRAGIISNLPFNFKPLTGALNISKLHLVFPPSQSLTEKEYQRILKGSLIEKTGRPDITDCLKSLFKAMLGTVFGSETQICGLNNVRKYYGLNPVIEIVIEELLNTDFKAID